MSETKHLGPRQEVWLRSHIPAWASLRDRAVAAGIIEPEAPAMTEEQARAVAHIAALRERVFARLQKPSSKE